MTRGSEEYQRSFDVGRALFYPAVFFAAAIVAFFALDLQRATFNVPFAYSSSGDDRFPEYGFDVTLYLFTVKGMLDNGWILTNAFLGAPGVATFHDFAQFQFDSLQFAMMKLISLIVRDAAATVNIYFLLGFPLTALISAYVMRQLKFGYASAFVFSQLYAFLPYHFHKGVYHLGYASYFLVPLVVLLSIWIVRGELSPRSDVVDSTNQAKRTFRLACLFAVLIGAWNLYYTFFAVLLLCIATAVAYANNSAVERQASLGRAVLLVIIIGLTVAIELIPILANLQRAGRNYAPVHREGFHSEWWGLRITQLVLPARDHRVEAMRVPAENLRSTWERALFGRGKPTLINTNESVALGVIGTIGFLSLIAVLFRRRPRPSWSLLDELARFNLGILLISTIGGFGMLFTILTAAYIRSYYRAAVFIAYFALLAAACLVERLRAPRKTLYSGTCAAALVLGLLDQIGEHARPAHQRVASAFNRDRAFFQKVEATLEPGSRVFQLPAHSFPEEAIIHRMNPYDGFIPYLHTRSLHWSFGAMNGRPLAEWQRGVGSMESSRMIDELRRQSFAGVLVDRHGLADESAVMTALPDQASQVLESDDGRFLFFKLRARS